MIFSRVDLPEPLTPDHADLGVRIERQPDVLEHLLAAGIGLGQALHLENVLGGHRGSGGAGGFVGASGGDSHGRSPDATPSLLPLARRGEVSRRARRSRAMRDEGENGRAGKPSARRTPLRRTSRRWRAAVCDTSPHERGEERYALKFSFSPGRGQRHLKSLPVDEQVTQASRMSAPPKQMLVVIRSGNGIVLGRAVGVEGGDAAVDDGGRRRPCRRPPPPGCRAAGSPAGCRPPGRREAGLRAELAGRLEVEGPEPAELGVGGSRPPSRPARGRCRWARSWWSR